MTTYYFDSSGIVKYYIPEPGSQWVNGVVDAQTKEGKWRYYIAMAQIGIVEVAAAIARRRRMGQISKRKQERTIQLATALLLNRRLLADQLSPLTFVSADDLLCHAARAEGLQAENPNEYE
jgi:predicted nucleic acid-binding protein